MPALKYLTVAQAAAVLNLNENTLRKKLREGALGYLQDGRKSAIRISVEALEEFRRRSIRKPVPQRRPSTSLSPEGIHEPPPLLESEYLTIRQAAEALGVSEKCLRGRLRRGRLRFMQERSKTPIRILREDLEQHRREYPEQNPPRRRTGSQARKPSAPRRGAASSRARSGAGAKSKGRVS